MSTEEKARKVKEFSILLQPQFAEFSKITDQVYLTGIGGMTTANFKQYKIDHIVNCTIEAPNWRSANVKTYRVAVDDTVNSDIGSHFDAAAETINQIVTNGGNVVVHCVAGVSRSAAIVVAYLMKFKGMNLRDAFNWVSKAREVVRPNNGFFRQLIDYEKRLYQTNSVHMVKLERDDVTIEIPDFFETDHKKLVLLEILKAKSRLQQQQQQQKEKEKEQEREKEPDKDKVKSGDTPVSPSSTQISVPNSPHSDANKSLESKDKTFKSREKEFKSREKEFKSREKEFKSKEKK